MIRNIETSKWIWKRVFPSFVQINSATFTGIPLGARFFAHVQIGPGAHSASCKLGTGSFPGVKRPRRGANHPPPSSAEVTKG
jgi:hypothetical protein